MPLNNFNQTLTVAGSVISIDEAKASFCLRARSGDEFEAFLRQRGSLFAAKNVTPTMITERMFDSSVP
jgi:hypothetical protein